MQLWHLIFFFIILVPCIDYYLIDFIYSFKYSFYTLNVAAENSIIDLSVTGDVTSVKCIEAKSLEEFNLINFQQNFSPNRKYGQ